MEKKKYKYSFLWSKKTSKLCLVDNESQKLVLCISCKSFAQSQYYKVALAGYVNKDLLNENDGDNDAK